MIIGTCSYCGGDVVDEYRNKPWFATTPPPPPGCTRCGATAGRFGGAPLPVIPTTPARTPDKSFREFAKQFSFVQGAHYDTIEHAGDRPVHLFLHRLMQGAQ